MVIQACTTDDVEVPLCSDCEFTCLDGGELNVITNECIDGWNCNFNLLPNAEVNIEENEGSGSGSNNVFQIINTTQGSSAIADDEFENILVFELDPLQSSFNVTDNELQLLNTHFNRVCYCSDVGFRAVTAGCMQGELRDDIWYVQGSLTIPFDFGDIVFVFDVSFVQ